MGRRCAGVVGRIEEKQTCLREDFETIGKKEDCDQYRAKIKKLKLEYHKAKDKNGKTERGRAMWRYFEALDAILGNKPATKPPIVIDTSAEEVIEDEAEASDYTEDEKMSDMTGKSQTTSLSTVTTEDEQEQPSNTSSGIKGKTGKQSREDRMESKMKMVVKEVVNSQNRSDKMLLEMEETYFDKKILNSQ